MLRESLARRLHGAAAWEASRDGALADRMAGQPGPNTRKRVTLSRKRVSGTWQRGEPQGPFPGVAPPSAPIPPAPRLPALDAAHSKDGGAGSGSAQPPCPARLGPAPPYRAARASAAGGWRGHVTRSSAPRGPRAQGGRRGGGARAIR